jgi:branched-chain amino acid transport system substrate-binding protein
MARCRLIAVGLLGLALAGCGASGTQPGGFTYETTLTVYSDLPLQGPQGALMTSINDGEILALEQAHARGADRNVSIELLDDGGPGGWSIPTTGHAARAAGQDLDAIAYIGDFDSGATAISLPLINANDILQVSPASSYAGFTDSIPEDRTVARSFYYPNGHATFARLLPTDLQEAGATVRFMRWLGVKHVYVLSDTAAASAPYDSAIAAMVARAAPSAGVSVAGISKLDTATPAGYASLIARIAAAHPDGVLLAAAPDGGAQILFQELHADLPALKLFAPSTLATAPFLGSLGEADRAIYVTSPILPLSQYPPAARAVVSAYRGAFATPPTAYSLYGYEAMSSILDAIQRAGKNASDRGDVIDDYFKLGVRHSVIGTYRIEPSGDTSLVRFAGYRVASGGALVELRQLSG